MTMSTTTFRQATTEEIESRFRYEIERKRRMTKRPFGFEFDIGTEAVYAIQVTMRSYQWKRVK
jgi:hypothetical protein